MPGKTYDSSSQKTFDEGLIARSQGKDLNDNPYTPRSRVKFNSWADGWKNGDKPKSAAKKKAPANAVGKSNKKATTTKKKATTKKVGSKKVTTKKAPAAPKAKPMAKPKAKKKAPAKKKTSGGKSRGFYSGENDGDEWEISVAAAEITFENLEIALQSYKTRSEEGYFPTWDKAETRGWMNENFILSRKGIELCRQGGRIDLFAHNSEQSIRRCSFLRSKG